MRQIWFFAAPRDWNFEIGPARTADMKLLSLSVAILALWSLPVCAGPPYVTDDPQPTDEGHFEIYGFTAGAATSDGFGGQAGIDFNYGGAADLQLTMVVPFAYEAPNRRPSISGFGDIEVAAKYRFLHQDSFGLDVAFFPRLFVSTNSDPALGTRHTALFLPIFAQKDWDNWSIFGGGGCKLNHGRDSQDFCQMGIVVTRRVTPYLQLGVEVYHQTPDERGARQTTGIGVGAIYDLSENLHLMASAGPGVQNVDATNQASWYAALLFTY
jgi:outer membrane putative beta-barrel porin/alpha-amylase